CSVASFTSCFMKVARADACTRPPIPYPRTPRQLPKRVSHAHVPPHVRAEIGMPRRDDEASILRPYDLRCPAGLPMIADNGGPPDRTVPLPGTHHRLPPVYGLRTSAGSLRRW